RLDSLCFPGGRCGRQHQVHSRRGGTITGRTSGSFNSGLRRIRRDRPCVHRGFSLGRNSRIVCFLSGFFRHKIHQGNPQRLSPCALRGCLLGKLHQRKRQHPALAVLIDQIDEIRHRQRKRLPRLPFLNFSFSNGGRTSSRQQKPNRKRQPRLPHPYRSSSVPGNVIRNDEWRRTFHPAPSRFPHSNDVK